MRVVIGGALVAWLRQRASLEWLGFDPALAPVSHEARWADVPPDWHAADWHAADWPAADRHAADRHAADWYTGRAEYDEDE